MTEETVSDATEELILQPTAGGYNRKMDGPLKPWIHRKMDGPLKP